MSSITDLIHIIRPDIEDEPEDIFAAASSLIFHDFRILHGDAGETIVYKSQRFGDVELTTANPEREDERRRFSHYLWNAGIKLAELISSEEANHGRWSVKDERVLELGAGVGLGGIVATLAGASKVCISDYPTPVVLANIKANAARSIPGPLTSRYSIEGHIWGEQESTFASKHRHHFTRVMAGDCLWMSSEHLSLVQSMLHFLTLEPTGRIFVVAAFHTGRSMLVRFFDIAIEHGVVVEEIYEEDDEGQRRPWMEERLGEVEYDADRKKWLVIACLMRKLPW